MVETLKETLNYVYKVNRLNEVFSFSFLALYSLAVPLDLQKSKTSAML